VLWKYQLFFYPDTSEVEMVRRRGRLKSAGPCMAAAVSGRRQRPERRSTPHPRARPSLPPCLQFDVKSRRHFLRRTRYDGLTSNDLYPGAAVTVFARQLAITECADDATRRALEARTQRCARPRRRRGLWAA
jgi:hypothetical protein